MADRRQSQDPAPFAALVAEHQRAVMGLGQSLGLSGADLDDAAAEAFAAVYSALPSFKGEAALSTWIYRIAYRVIVKARARRRRHRTAELVIDPPLTGGNPADLAADADAAAAVWAAVAALPDPRQAAAVELHYRRGWPIERVADVMACPVGTVKTLLFRARQRLKVVLVEREVYP
jgi:RNA polymerase sigma-70 factor (ECF subfamily)